jgi:prepilin-type N-terminal cleavage/methylation domain-containing protein
MKKGGSAMLETRPRGFTLIEMIMVLGLIGIATAISGPKIASALQKRTTASAVDQFALTHSLSRATAIRYARVAQLHIDVAGKRFWVDVDTSANGTGQRAIIDNVRDMSTAGLTMTSNRALLCFDARGLPSTSGGCEAGDAKIVFSDGAQTDSLVTTVLGKILR